MFEIFSKVKANIKENNNRSKVNLIESAYGIYAHHDGDENGKILITHNGIVIAEYGKDSTVGDVLNGLSNFKNMGVKYDR